MYIYIEREKKHFSLGWVTYTCITLFFFFIASFLYLSLLVYYIYFASLSLISHVLTCKALEMGMSVFSGLMATSHYATQSLLTPFCCLLLFFHIVYIYVQKKKREKKRALTRTVW
ncbi:hypothetical protein, unlikely [Trypanosoma brucei gambiense DAL972]|uniref:Uncharacterized protein n=1 Tax=Trypanosoma brucei gambiense (strain MHOM/CI/86/DAL972) TaxID=679716 RepID=C9ZJW5_TRYB9|nr:hypothetical protein, unlikely [Trypanosoma brucei gambiense DAL972]CBH09729.1 hypothetical protein, unlikely [Trypanosoma brucei gambiense DAL972]|eukprot:XP_011772022.1 hypothetical protein, unlikely [Trypanosoma brucei gambiense DAL972]